MANEFVDPDQGLRGTSDDLIAINSGWVATPVIAQMPLTPSLVVGHTVGRKQVMAPFCYKIKGPHSVENGMLGPKQMVMDL